MIGHAGFQICFYFKERDSKYNREKYDPESESLSGTKAICDKHINLTILVLLLLLMLSSLFKWTRRD
jgi:hypothetical protein